jgi:hypothetical protein
MAERPSRADFAARRNLYGRPLMAEDCRPLLIIERLLWRNRAFKTKISEAEFDPY